MEELRRFTRWTVPGTLAVFWVLMITSLPGVLSRFGSGHTPLPGLGTITIAEVSMIAGSTVVLGVVVEVISYFLPTTVLISGIVRRDMAGEVLRMRDILAWVRLHEPEFPAADPLTAKLTPLLRANRATVPDGSVEGDDTAATLESSVNVYRLAQVVGWHRVTRDIRRAWRLQTAHNAGLLLDALAMLSTDQGKDLKAKYAVLTDSYRAMGTCRVAVLLAAVVGQVEIIGWARQYSIPVLTVSSILATLASGGLIAAFSRHRADLLQARARIVQVRLAFVVRLEPMWKDAYGGGGSPTPADASGPDPTNRSEAGPDTRA